MFIKLKKDARITWLKWNKVDWKKWDIIEVSKTFWTIAKWHPDSIEIIQPEFTEVQLIQRVKELEYRLDILDEEVESLIWNQCNCTEVETAEKVEIKKETVEVKKEIETKAKVLNQSKSNKK